MRKPCSICAKARQTSHRRRRSGTTAATSNWIPAFCYTPPLARPGATEAARSCSSEYPDHDTMTVLALVNQVWGLQKEPSPELQPILTLGG